MPARAHTSDAVRHDRPRILIVDDSAIARSVLARIVEASGRFKVAAAMPGARAALGFLQHNRVDAILLDLAMPDIDGLTALPDILAASAGAKVMIVSSSCGDGAAASAAALALGAADTLAKPDLSSPAGAFGGILDERLSQLLVGPQATGIAARTDSAARLVARSSDSAFDIVAIGASTGGIHALSLLLREIPADFSPPILITQHLPGSFMPYFAAQVAILAGRPCDVATDRMRVRPGRVIIAPGKAHMRCVRMREGTAIRLSTGPVRSGCMPSVDPMFDSLADVFGARALGIVLSGMGRDGSDGARRMIECGCSVVVQDQASSVVWGMPGAVAATGLASAILPPTEIGRLVASGMRPGC